MKRFIIVLLPVLMIAMESELKKSKPCPLRRTYSIHPAVDSLKEALMDDETELINERLDQCLPQALDRQYALLGLTLSQDARLRLLTFIEAYWFKRITEHPATGLDSFMFDLKRLDESYGLKNLTPHFKIMLSSLKAALLAHKALQSSEVYRSQVASIPAYSNGPSLRSLAAFMLADEIVQEIVDDLPPELEEVVRRKPLVDLPFSRMINE